MKNDEIRAANRKALPKFLLLTLVGAVIGGVTATAPPDTGLTSCPAFWRTRAHSSARASPHG